MKTNRLQIAGVIQGPQGDPGKTAYQLALDNGFVGTEEEWLDSLKGQKGDKGDDGYTPTINLTEEVDGVTVSVQNKDGQQTIKVKNGKDYEHSEEFTKLADQVRSDKKLVDQAKISVDQAKQSVDQAKTSIDQSKSSVDQTVSNFEQTARQAVEGVNNSKTQAISDITTVKDAAIKSVSDTKTQAVSEVNTTKDNALSEVTDAGSTNVQAVEEKGKAVLESIPQDYQTAMTGKLDKQHGAENAGKILVVGEDGNVIPRDSIKTDQTLTQSGQAADAKATGDSIDILKENISTKLDKQQSIENAGKVLMVGEDGNVVPGKVQSGGIMKLVRKFTIPQDTTQEPSDITYIVSDDGKVKMFMVDKDGNGQPLRLRRFIIFLKKNSIIGNDTIPLYNMGVRINVNITENKNHMLWYRSVNNKTQSLYFDIEKIGVSAKGHAYSFSLGSDYTYYSTMTSVNNASVSFYENMFKDNNEPIHTISIIEPSYETIDLRGATVTIYGEVM